MDQTALPFQGFDQVEDEVGLQPGEAPACRGEIEAERQRHRPVAERGKRGGHRLDLDQHILLVRRGVGGDGAVEDRHLAALAAGAQHP